MKVTTELKNLIKGEFNRKRNALRDELNEYQKTGYKSFCENVEKYDKDFKNLKDACDKFTESFSDTIWGKSGTFSTLKNISPKNLFWSNLGYDHPKMVEINSKLAKLDLDENTLLVKLTYERDIDAIKEMLESYDINIL